VEWLKLAEALVNGGAVVMLVALVIVVFVGLYRRWWVPGWMFDRSEARAEKADTQAERNAESLEVMAKAHDRIAQRLDSITSGWVKRD
jgi:hypothetical protein